MEKFTVNTHHAYLNNKILVRAEDWITIEDSSTGQKYKFQNVLEIRLSAGLHILKSRDHEEKIIIEDAIKLGGSKVKSAFVFDNTPWVFVTLKSATKPFNVLLACTRPLITELSYKLRQKCPLLPTTPPYPIMRLETIRSIIPISCRRHPKSVWNTSA